MPLFRHLYDLKDVFRAPSGLFLALGPLSGVLVTRWNLDSLTIFSIFHIDSKKQNGELIVGVESIHSPSGLSDGM